MSKIKTIPVVVLQNYIDCIQSKDVDLLTLARYLASKSNGLFEIVETRKSKANWILKRRK